MAYRDRALGPGFEHLLPTEAVRARGTPGVRPAARLGWIACGWFLAVSLPMVIGFRHGERSSWVRMCFPGDAVSPVSLFGYNYRLGAEPYMQENAGHTTDVAFFSGVGGQEPFLGPTIHRVYFGFFATLLTPLVGMFRAMLLVNWLSWALCAWVAWVLTNRLFHDRLAGLLAVVFVSGGPAVMHVSDFSAHFLSFASYYLGVYLIYDSGVLLERRPLRTHLLLGAYFAVASLVYYNGFMLTVVYVLASWRHQHRGQVAGAVLLALSAMPLWKQALGLFGVTLPQSEADLLIYSLHAWVDGLRDPWSFVQGVARVASEYACFDFPVLVALGLVSCLVLPRQPEVRWFGITVVGVPLACALLYLDFQFNRGYLIYGVSIWLYCWLGGLLAKGLRARWTGLLTGAVLCLLVAGQLAWSTAYTWDGIGPFKTYLFGWRVGWPHLSHPPAEVVSMTGFEKTPVLFGGRGSLREAGIRVEAQEVELKPGEVSVGAALRRRLLPAVYLALLAGLLAGPGRRGLLAGGTVAAVTILTAGLSAVTLHALPRFSTNDRIRLPPGATLTFRAELAPGFVERLATRFEPGDSLCVYVPQLYFEEQHAEASVSAGATPVAVEEGGPHLETVSDPPAALRALAGAGDFTVTAVNHTDVALTFSGWQRPGLPGRSAGVVAAADAPEQATPVLPAVEIRLLRPDGSLKLAGF